MNAAQQHYRPRLALLIRLAAMATMATLSALIKLASTRGIHLAEIIFWRQFVVAPLLLGWLWMRGQVSTLKTKRPLTHLGRGLYGLVGMLLNFGAVIALPLAEATTFSFTVPIFAVILSIVLLKEHVGLWRWSAVIGGFAGILLIAQPGGGHIPLFGAALALGGAFMVALISIQIADLNRTEKPVTIVFWFAAVTAPISALALPFVHTHLNTGDWLLLILLGVVGLFGQLLLTTALRFGTVASVIVMDYSALFWATLYGWLLFDSLPPASTWIGAPVIILSGLVIAWREHHLAVISRKQSETAQGT